MKIEFVLMHMGKPVVVSADEERLHRQAVAEARLAPAEGFTALNWNVDRSRLFRQDSKGHSRFTGYEVKQVVRA